MQTTVAIVAAVAAHYGSDRKAAPHFGVSQTTFSRWHTGEDHPSEERAIQMAELLQLDPAFVLAIVRADKAKTADVRTAWQRIAAAFAKAAGIGGFALAASVGGPAPADAASLHISEINTHCKRKRRSWVDAVARTARHLQLAAL